MGQCRGSEPNCHQYPVHSASVLGEPSALSFLPSSLREYGQQYTLFANATMHGSPVARALFMEFPDEPELFGVDEQFMVGHDILVTPVLAPSVNTVNGNPVIQAFSSILVAETTHPIGAGHFPGRGQITWRDWYTHDVVNASASGSTTSLSAPLGHINVHIRDGSAILCSGKPAYTIEETRQGPYSLLISLTKAGTAFGTAYLDDGESFPLGSSQILTFTGNGKKLTITSEGKYSVGQKLDTITIMGVAGKPNSVKVNGKSAKGWTFAAGQDEVVIEHAGLSMNQGTTTISWS